MDKVNWKKELDNLVSTAENSEDRAATEAFAKALRPFLDDTRLLRTLLGKIQSYLPEGEVVVVTEQRFKL